MSNASADPYPTDLIPSLRAAGLVVSENPAIRVLSGGVSCDILLIEEGDRRIVVKRALEKLRVKDEWFADTARNRYEQAYMRYANEVAPGSVPRILHADGERNFFAMEYLGDGWANWKTELLAGRVEPRYARTAGETLAAIHRASWGDGALQERFATTPNFFKLRIEPYLLTTGTRNPALEPHFKAEAERLGGASLALVHGDFSPKNIMLDAGSARMAIIDCEVAWFGDPAFDIAFFLNHLLLKALHRPPVKESYLSLGTAFLEAYRPGLGGHWSAQFEARATRLLLMLLLARVDGKSPVEYLLNQTGKQGLVREFVARELPDPPATFAALAARWAAALPQP
jgi:aminoglycoside phosphotransferase (APT) family kinase protein